MPRSYLNSSYITDISNQLHEIKERDLSLNEYMDINITPPIEFESSNLDNLQADTSGSNFDFYKDNKYRSSEWMQSLSSQLQYLYDMSGQHYLANRIIYGNNDENGEMELLQKNIDEVEQEIVENKKVNQINEYYEKKRQHQILIFKHVSYILLVLVVISFLFQMGLVSETWFIGIIGIGIACLIIYLGIETFDMMFRDNVNYDEHTYIYSGYYLDKSNKNVLQKDMPLHAQKDKLSSECAAMLS